MYEGRGAPREVLGGHRRSGAEGRRLVGEPVGARTPPQLFERQDPVDEFTGRYAQQVRRGARRKAEPYA